MGLAINNLAPASEDRASGAQIIDGSLRFDSGNSTHLNRTPGSAGNRRTWTFSCWVKLGSLSQGERGTIFQSSGGPTIYQDSGLRFAHAWDPAGTDYIRETVALFRDPSAWYHVVWWCDTTQSGTRWKIYVNGVEQTLQTPSSNNGEPAQNTDLGINSTNEHTIGEFASYSYLDGYLSQAYFVDGQALDASYFGFTDPLTNTWRPKKYTGTYGTNGFYLDFSDSSNLGADRSGNGNNFTPTGFTADDVVPDSPSGVVFSSAPTSGITTNNSGPSNYATLNPLWNPIEATYAEGNLKFTGGATHSPSVSSISASSGKFYFEATALSGSQAKWSLGIIDTAITYRKISGTNYIPGYVPNNVYSAGDAISLYDNNIYKNGSVDVSSPFSGGAVAAGNVVQMAVDLDSGKMWFGINDTWNNGGGTEGAFNPSGHDTTFTANDDYIFHFTAENCGWEVNFGQKDFSYTPPSGFLPLCTANLPRPTEAAVRPDKYFATTLWTGDNTSNRTITTGLQSDFIWIKRRDSAVGHLLFDSVRGAGKTLRSQSTGAESDDGSYYVQQFNSDNFLLGTSDSASNATGGTYVSWTWKAGGNSNTYNIDGIGYATASAAGLDGGSVNPTSASVGTEQGFSIIKWNPTPATVHTVSHGLGKIPKFMIFKQTNASSAWSIYHEAIGATNRLTFTTDASTSDTVFGNTAPTDTVFTNNLTSGSNEGIAYLWAEIPGFSKFGSYTGNNNADGPFVHCGFKPAWVMIKNADAASTEWYILDNKRDPDNPVGEYLSASSNAAESTYIFYDFLSNGFKLRNTGSAQNPSSQTIIFAAFAEAPTNNLFGGQANAR